MHTPATQVILIGGSAGAYDLIVKILEVLPKPCNHAVVVILHRNPKFASSIEKSLSEKFGRDVSQAKDKESIRSNVIYFAPPGYHLLMEPDYSFSLDISDPVDFSRPSINVSFESAADVYGTHLKLFLLSGANADGAKGLAYAFDRGASCFVQATHDALVPVMPSAGVQECPDATALDNQQLLAYFSTID